MVGRDSILRWVGPGMLTGATLGVWIKLLAKHGLRPTPSNCSKAFLTTLSAAVTSVVRCWEDWHYRARVEAQPIAPPLFVLGHWRSGTTYLHNLLSVDRRFAYPRFMDVMYPHTFLSAEPLLSATFGHMLPTKRFGLDEIPIHPRAPFEEEFSLGIMTSYSPYLSWVFPESAAHFDRYLTFRDASDVEVRRWQEAMQWILRKLSWKYRLPLVLKSPPHTARIRMLLEIFPDAKFVHIHRDPYAVYRSTAHLHTTVRRYFSLQRAEYEQQERILSLYDQMFDSFFEQRGLIPADRFVEVGYRDLTRAPLEQMQQIYDQLQLPDFEVVKPALERHIAGLAGYQSNKHAELPDDVRKAISSRWRRSFDTWGYAG